MKLRKFCAFLKKFYEVIVKISGTAYVTFYLRLDDLCDVYASINSLLVEDDIELSVMGTKMKEKYDKY